MLLVCFRNIHFSSGWDSWDIMLCDSFKTKLLPQRKQVVEQISVFLLSRLISKADSMRSLRAVAASLGDFGVWILF